MHVIRHVVGETLLTMQAARRSNGLGALLLFTAVYMILQLGLEVGLSMCHERII